MSVSTRTPAPWSRKRIRSLATGRIASGSSCTVTPSWRRKSGRLPSTWLAEWISDSPNAPWETMRIPIMDESYNGAVDRTMPRPTEITLHQQSRVLDVAFDDGKRFSLPCEYLRVYSPSAEVRGHGPGQEVLQKGKRLVNVAAIEPVGVYAVKLVFSDGHDTGIYSWDYLYDLGVKYQDNWNRYLARLEQSGASRDP